MDLVTTFGRGLVVFPYPSWLARIDPCGDGSSSLCSAARQPRRCCTARGAGATAGDAGDRISPPQSPEVYAEPFGGFNMAWGKQAMSVGDVAIEFRWADNQSID